MPKRFKYPVIWHCFFLTFILTTFINNINAQNSKPNIIFVLGDDIGYKTLTVNGGKSYSTPNLDSMAHNGINFTECQASPLCSPSRFMLLTGKYNFRNYTQWGNMDTSQKTIANMLKDAGYATACFGKWQFNGGDTSIHKFGFDNYCVVNPVLKSSTEKYKNPHIYVNGEFVADSLTAGKYGDDIFTDSILNFIERNKSTPFFVYYPMGLAHPPFQPTPDDSAYAKWSSDTLSDTIYYPSMIKYMDKKIGEIVSKVKQLSIENNTVIIYAGDNGTPTEVSQSADDSLLTGGKGLTTEDGTHVPLIILWPAAVKPNSINNDLIGFTDLLPTLAHIANTSVPANFEPLDGVDFTPQIKGKTGTPRDWLFYHYDPNPRYDTLRRWVQTKQYKLYDTSGYNLTRLFYNIKEDVNELNPIPKESLSSDELSVKQQLLAVMNNYIRQGYPLLFNAGLAGVSDTSAILADSVRINGGSTITAIGAVWSTEPDPVISSSPHTLDGQLIGPFESLIKGLNANTTYCVRAFAKNFAGITYGNELKFKTLLHPPFALLASGINNNKFVAHWHPIKSATAYKIDVSTSSAFATFVPAHSNQQFNNGIIPPAGWAFFRNISTNNSVYGQASPSLQFKSSNAQVVTKQLSGSATELKFWIEGINTNQNSYLRVEGFDGTTWIEIDSIYNLPRTNVTKIYDSVSPVPLANNFIQFRFTYTKSQGTLVFDDVAINYNNKTPLFVPGYNGLKVEDTSFIVKGLKADNNYFYRVRAVSANNTSDNSNIIAVTTCASQECNTNAANKSYNTSIVKNNELKVEVFPNPSSDAFVLNIKNSPNQKSRMFITDVYGKKIYQAIINCNENYVFGKEFTPGIYFVHLMQYNNSKTLKLIKEK